MICMGQFVHVGKNILFMSKADLAKSSDIDDSFWCAVTYYDFGVSLNFYLSFPRKPLFTTMIWWAKV